MRSTCTLIEDDGFEGCDGSQLFVSVRLGREWKSGGNLSGQSERYDSLFLWSNKGSAFLTRR